MLLSLSLGHMIGALNAIQIIMLTILFRLSIPVNMFDIFGPLLQLSNFDVFKTDIIYEIIFGFGETEPFDQIFEEAGFEGSNFIVGIGPLFIIVVLSLVWIIIQKCMKHIIKRAKIKVGKTGKYLQSHGDREFQIMMFTMESALEIGMSVFITIIVV